MDSAALARLRHVGKLFTVAGTAAQRLGQFLENPGAGEIEECFTHLANCFVEASTVCESLSDLAGSQHAAGQGHGYGISDSAALASFRLMFEGFGAPVVCVSCLDFTLSGDEKSVCWMRAAETLRRSADASRRQIGQLGRLLPEQANAEP